ncbi:MAG: protein kinase, partial [candidate division Zixibacteria bacterium]|nr:protein kinase [candidate division Zixibacteria bacterium]
MIGKTISHYKILEKLGEGGMGVVYKAQDTKLDRIVALKFLPKHLLCDSEAKIRFEHEAKAASALNHTNITTIYEIDEVEGECFIAMEYIEGKSIKKLIEEKNLSLKEVIDIASQVCEGLVVAHEKGIVHRDIKSDNIMVTPRRQVKIMDFGLAKLKGASKVTKTGSTLGTLPYMSPEQAQGIEVDRRSDIFSFGVVLYEMITGQLPFKGEHEAAIIYSILNETPEPLARYKSGVSAELQNIINKALAKDKGLRYQHADELAADLKRLTSASGPVPATRRRGVRVLLPLIAVLVLISAALIFKPWRIVIKPSAETATGLKRVVVVPFQNQTGDASLAPLGRMVADWTTQSLLQTGLAEVVPPEKVPELEKLKSVRSIAKATGASMIVMGSYYKLGETIQFQAKVMDAKEKLLVAIDPVASPVAKTMDGVEAVRQRVLGALAFVLDKPVEGYLGTGLKPPSYEAYQQHIQGVDLFLKQFDYPGAIEYFKRAYAIDTQFISPLFWAGFAYGNLGQLAQADSLVRFLNLRRAQLTPLRQLHLDFLSSSVSGDRMKALDAMRKAAKIAPGSIDPYDWGHDAYRVNRPKEAIEAFKTANQEQQWLPYWNFFTASYHFLGEHEKELEIAKQARKRFPDSFSPLQYEVRALAALGKIEEVKNLIEESLTLTKPGFTTGSPGGTMRIAGEELRAHGYADAAMRSFDQAIQWYRSRPAEEMDSLLRYPYGLTLYDARRWEEAKSIFEELAKKSPDNIEYQGYLGFIAARQGDREKAFKVSEWLKNLKKPYPFGEQTYYRARIAAILGEKDQAVTLLKDSSLQGFWSGFQWRQLHTDVDFESLWDYPPFKEMLKPKG